jgi:hypothetical protein
MRCYFNLVNSGQFILDPEGIEIGDAQALHSQVAEAVEEFCLRNGLTAKASNGWQFQVTDESGSILFTLDLGSVLPPDTLVGLAFGTLLPLHFCELSEHLVDVIPYATAVLSV